MGFLFFILIIVVVVGLLLLLGALNFVMSILRGIFSLGRPQNKTSYKKPSEQAKPKEKNIFFNKQDAEDAEYEEIKD